MAAPFEPPPRPCYALRGTMDNGVDIIIASDTGHPELVVQVKRSVQLDVAEAQVREYMRRAGVPIGLVVGSESIRLLRDTYRTRDSIELVGKFRTGDATGLRVSEDPIEFEEAVQRWLESLGRNQDAIAEPLRTALRKHVIPIIEAGSVRAAGPRARRAAS